MKKVLIEGRGPMTWGVVTITSVDGRLVYYFFWEGKSRS